METPHKDSKTVYVSVCVAYHSVPWSAIPVCTSSTKATAVA